MRRLASLACPLVVGLCLAILTSTSFAQDDQASRQEELNQLIAAGEQSLEAEEYEKAVEAFSQAITKSGGYQPRPYIGRAAAYNKLEEYEAAIEDIKEALTYGNSDPAVKAAAQNLRGEIYLELGALDLAIQDLQAAVTEDRSNLQYQFNYGKALALTGNAVQAEKALTKYLEANSDNAEAYRLRGQAYAGMGKFDEALNDVKLSLQIEPNAHEAFFTEGLVYLQQKEYALAAEALDEAIQNYTPEEEDDETPYIQAHLTRASMLEEAGKAEKDPARAQQYFAAGKAECERLLDAMPDNPNLQISKGAALFRLGVAERLLGNNAPAVKAFSEAIDINPSLGEAFFRRGICFHDMDEELLAIRDFEQAASIDFESPRANLWQGRSWAKLGDYYEAVKSYGKALAVSDRYTDAYVGRGLAYMQLGEYAKAIEDFNEAIRLDPTQGAHYYYRGVAFDKLGNRQRALNSLANAVAFDDKLAPAYRYLGQILQSTGRGQLGNEYQQKANELESANN